MAGQQGPTAAPGTRRVNGTAADEAGMGLGQLGSMLRSSCGYVAAEKKMLECPVALATSEAENSSPNTSGDNIQLRRKYHGHTELQEQLVSFHVTQDKQHTPSLKQMHGEFKRAMCTRACNMHAHNVLGCMRLHAC